MGMHIFVGGVARRLHYLFLGLLTACLTVLHVQAEPMVVNVDHRVTVSYSKPQFDAKKNVYAMQARIKNNSGGALIAPLQLSFDETSLKNFRIVNAQGIGTDGRPYFVIEQPKGVLLSKDSTKPVSIFVVFDKEKVARSSGGALTTAILSAAQHVSAGVAVAPLDPRAEPYALRTGTGKVKVRFSVRVVGLVRPDMAVFLRLIGKRNTYLMNDAGQEGDMVAKDGIYGATLEVDADSLKPDSCLRYEAVLRHGKAEATSAPFNLCSSSFPLGLAESNLGNLLEFPDGSKALTDEVMIKASPTTGSAEVAKLADLVSARIVGSIPGLRIYQLKLATPADQDGLLKKVKLLRATPGVESATVNGIGDFALTPNDAAFINQHGLKQAIAHDAATGVNVWDTGATGGGVTVVVLDSGLDVANTDISPTSTCQLATGPALVACSDSDPNGHGTKVGGVIGAIANNALGVAGVAYGSSLHSIRTGLGGGATVAQIAAVIDAATAYVASHGAASIVNVSYAYPAGFVDWTPVCQAIESLVWNGGVPRALVATAAGNSGINGQVYPARCNDLNAGLVHKQLLTVVANSVSGLTNDCLVGGAGAQNAVNTLCNGNTSLGIGGSNYGNWVDLAAPGGAIWTTNPGLNNFSAETGTSISSPFVAGASAILKSCGVALDQIELTLESSANVLVSYPASGGNPAGSTPRLDIYRALQSVNQTPTTINISNSSLNENTNTAAGVLVGNLTTVSTDTCDKYTYSIFGGADAAVFSIGGANGDQLRIAAGVLNFETKPTYTVIVRVTDFFGAVRNRTFTINVTDLNEAPTAVVLSNTVPSTPENGGSVKVADISVTDDALGTNVLSLAGADAASFSLVGNALNFNGGANFEVKSTYNVTVRVNDAAVGGNPDASQAFTLNITNVNESPVVANQVFTVSEGSSSGYVLGSVVASDPDTGASLTYSITGPNPGDFGIGTSSGQVAVGAVAMDFETTPVYTFTVQVSDGSLSATATITVNVTNVNEPPTAVSFANVVPATPENGGSVKVADIIVTDDALGTNVLSVPAGPFSVVGNALYFNGGADFETLPAYSVVVSVDDISVGATPDAFQTFNLAITDVNEAPNSLSLVNTVTSTPENGGSLKVADIIVTDDALGTNALSVNSPSFSIVGSSLYFNGGADYETLASYNVTVSVDDVAVGATPDASQSLTLTITDVNEAPTVVQFSNVVSATPENGGDIKVADIAIIDDAMGVNTLLLSGTDPGMFSLVGNELHFNGSADFETKNAYGVTVDVNDPAVGGAVDASQTFNLAITNANEQPSIANQSFNHVEYWSGTPFDPFIGIVAANDPDAGDTLTFTITSGNEATVANNVVQSNAFAFDPATPGRLVANNTAALNFEYKPVFNLGVQVTDAGGLSSSAAVTVNLGDDATDNGDPHINTVDRLHYDFQSAGEFVALRGKNGMEIQVRQTPVSTATPLTDPLSGLTSGVSVNTALAMRVGKRRVTYQAENGAPVLRVDGAVTTLQADGIDLGDGGRVLPQGGGIKVDFPDGTTLLATASPWAYYNVWWVNFSVHHTTAREGIMGARKNGSWLPRLSDGSAFGPMPVAMHDRYVELYVKFADSWRVNEKTSLFDYAEGTSTATYTNKAWPTESGPYVADSKPPVKALPRKDAQLACRGVLGKVEQADCVFDVMVMGHKDIAKGHLLNQKLRLGATDVLVREVDVLTKRREKVFIATVARVAAAPLLDRKAKLAPTGSVQFMLEGKPLGNPVRLDTKGQARIVLPVLKLGKGTVTARFIPTRGSVLLPSISKLPIRVLRPIEPVLIRGIR